MLIATRLRLATGLSTVFFFALVALLYVSYLKLNDARVDMALALQIKVNYFERTSYRDLYFLNREERVKAQWEYNKKESDRLLRQGLIKFQEEIDLLNLELLRRQIEDCSAIFHRFVNNTAALKSTTAIRPIYLELDNRLSSQLLLKSASVRQSVNVLEQRIGQRLEHTFIQQSLLASLLVALLALAGILNTVQLNRLIQKRLTPLREGAAIMSGGELNHRICIEGSDEFSGLAQSLNAMSDKLGAILSEQRFAKENLRVAAAAFETHDAILITDAEVDIIRVNAAFVRITGYSEAEVIGKNPRLLSSGRESGEFYEELWNQLLKTGMWAGEMWNRAQDGTVFPKWLTITAVKDEAGKISQYVGIYSDITDRKRAEQEIHNLAFYDPLTGLPTR